ncbi:MAG: DUF2339 domain-containing protein [Bacteroidota bacterium]|nr:DUF2339 domain-containing protein [Bacteroidota bacterium]MDP3143885.1 DUF2339 domain-containing protein [Bacteroidota bacterium]
MEIFLLLVIIVLLIVFHLSKNSKLKKSEERLSNIENYLKKVNFSQSQKTTTATTETAKEVSEKIIPPTIKPEIVPPIIVETPPVVIKETIIPPIKEVEKVISNTTEPIKIIPQQQKQPVKPLVRQEDWYTKFRKNNPDLEKFIGENILSKIAITILVLGIAFFVKYAIDKEWINEIARVGIGILCGGIVLGFAHYLHKKFKAFSSVLVGGGIAIFYFTIGIAFHQYHIFDQTTAFIIMLLITGFSVFISILYDRIELAAISIIGGFATPFMVSTGQGNYQVLFTYILILDIGMLILAYMRKWNLINILAYVFTMILYFGWLQSKVIGQFNPPYKGALIFGAVFYLIFILMNIINNIKEKRKFAALDLTLLISNTFLFFGGGMQILNYYHPELKGLFSILLAGFNLICSFLLYKKFKADAKLVYLMIGLTLTFITIAAPVQLRGNYITIFWALEAVLLIWLSQKSQIVLFRFASIILTLLMGLSLFIDWVNIYSNYNHQTVDIIFNKAFITGLISSLSLLGIVFLLRKDEEKLTYLGITFNPKKYSSVLKGIFISLIYLTGFLEVVYQVNDWFGNTLTVPILIMVYHLLFVVILNSISIKIQNKATQIFIYILNLISLIIFIVGLSWMPITELKESLLTTESNQIGFIFHYVSLLAVIFIVFRMYKMIHQKEAFIKDRKILNTTLISIAIVYISSIELILHVLKLNLTNVYNLASDDDYFGKIMEISTVETHIIKIGFPILWGILAFVFLFIGMKKYNKTFRIASLLLIALILLKLFTYDIKDASEAGKIIAFIILGVVLLIISFMYQKIKALLIDDTKNKETFTEPNPDSETKQD